MADVSTRGLEITVSQKLVTETCCECGMLFAMTSDLKAQLLGGSIPAKRTFFCPSGHSQYFTGKTEAQKLREELESERRQRQRIEQDNAYQRDRRREAEAEAKHERNRANGYKGHATRITKRAKAGVCPCCNRSFENLRRHMATKHPTFTPMPLEVIDGGKAA